MTLIWPIGGGKGGTGKSFFTGNLGVSLAELGYSTLVVDADLGAPNLHTMIGLTEPSKSLSDFIYKRTATLTETVDETHIPQLYLISGARNNLDIVNLAHEQKVRVMRAITKLPYDFILLDLGAGTSFNTIDFFMISDSGIFITTPEPTAIENIYRLIRSVYFRKIRQVLKLQHFQVLAEEAGKRNQDATVNNPEILLDMVREMDPEQGKNLEEALRSFQFQLVVNQVRRQDNPNLGSLVCKIIQKHLGLRITFAGNISFDDRIHDSVCQKVSYLRKYPYTQAATDIRDICKSMLSLVETLPAKREQEKASGSE
ncbi:MAG: AAA family ATPase [Syntrophales bacterium]|nr:AAA family ATPase [Syntrophales bacterium]